MNKSKKTRKKQKKRKIICIYQKFVLPLQRISKLNQIKGGGNTIKTATKT